MRAAAVIVMLSFVVGGCSAYPERQSLGYGDYVAYSCDELGQEAVRLMKQTADRSEHLIGGDQARRDSAVRQLQSVKRASTDKKC